MAKRTTLFALVLLTWAGFAKADIIIDPPQQITRRVTVQLIQTALDNGSSPATVFGNATQRADIEGSIDSIWAQAGIDIAFLPTINRYNNTFAYQGNAGSGSRPTSDFNTVLTNARNAGGILNADTLVLNLMMVNVVPGFAPLPEDNTAGYARIGGNGMLGYAGDNLLTFGNGRDAIASVMAHEIGHNLGLDHTGSNQNNLMSPGGDTEQLSSSQIAIALSSSFARVITTPITGDYNGDSAVNAADYVVWRKNNGSQSGYNTWRMDFGETPGSGAGLSASAAVPEPSTALMFVLAAFVLHVRGRFNTVGRPSRDRFA